MYVLDQCKEYSDYISWNYNIDPKNPRTTVLGHAITVHDIDLFASEVMPAFFGKGKYESFQRQLYRWGFVKIKMNKGNSSKGRRSFTYRQTDEMFIEKDWGKCSILSYSKTLKYANPFFKKDTPCHKDEMNAYQKPEDYTFEKRASLISDSGNGASFKDAAAIVQQHEFPMTFVMTSTPPPDTLQTQRRKSNSNLLNLEDINVAEVNKCERVSSNLLPLSSIYNSQQAVMFRSTFNSSSNIGVLDSDSGMVLGSGMPSMTPQIPSVPNVLPDFSQTLYTKSILQDAMTVLHNDSRIDRKESK